MVANYTQEELDAAAGENNTKARAGFIRLNFDGAMGVMGIDRGTNKGEVIESKDLPLEVVLLSVRVSYKRFDKDNKGKMKAVYFTNEGKSAEAIFTLKARENGVTTKIDQDKGKTLQEGWDLKQTSVLYLLLKSGEVVRLEVQGKSAGNLFSFYKQFVEGEHKRDFKCLIDISQESFEDKATGETKDYYALTFNKGEAVKKIAVKAIGEKIMELAEKFAVMDKQAPSEVEKTQPKTQPKPEPQEEAEEEAVEVDEDESADDIDPVDIPF